MPATYNQTIRAWMDSPLLIRWSRSITLWSDPETWGGFLPEEGDTVVIPSGKRILLDVDPPPLTGLQIDGTLIFDDRELNLFANWIMVYGELRIGSEGWPHQRRAVITLTDGGADENVMGLGTKFLAVMSSGALELHGEWRPGWAKLNATAEPGATRIIVERAVNWQFGDRIVLAPSEGEPGEAEERFVIAVNGNLVTLDRPLRHRHWGVLEYLEGVALDERAEVGLLTRNIVLQGHNEPGSDFGGCLLVMPGAKIRVEGLEATGLGQRGRMERYPVQCFAGAEMFGSYLRHSSLHHNFRHGVWAHRTRGLQMKNNVIYDVLDDAYFLQRPNGQEDTGPLSPAWSAPETVARPAGDWQKTVLLSA